MTDIYFDENYYKLYEDVEKGKGQIYKCKTKNGEIVNQFIKREIPIKINGKTYYDIVTPYGYGGPYIKESIDKEGLLEDYKKDFSEYCKENNIVSEFVRFHPLYNNAKDFKEIYNSTFNRHTLGTNLKYEDPIKEEFGKSCRKNIKRKLKNGMTYKITENPTDFKNFKECYYSTMDRNEAGDYYYFDDKYFENIEKYFKNNTIVIEIIYENKVIAAGIYFISDNNIHVHLSGTKIEYIKLSPAYILRYAVTIWGKENGYNVIHHGGGRTSSEEDALYKFKEQFARKTKFDFYLGKKIFNQKIYDKLCESTNTDKNEDYFPAYRKNI